MNQDDKKPRVLLVDDDPDLNESLTPLLETILNATIAVAMTGDEAIGLILGAAKSQNHFALMILDMQLPPAERMEVDTTLGLKLIRAFRDLVEEPILPPVIVFTNFPSYENCVECITAGAHDYIPKSIQDGDNTEALLARCQKIVNPSDSDQELLDWCNEHIAELQQFGDQYLAIFDQNGPMGEKKIEYRMVGARLVVAASSYVDVLRRILQDRHLRWMKPDILPPFHAWVER